MEMPPSEDSKVLTDVSGVFHLARLEAGGAELAPVYAGFTVTQTRLEGSYDARTELEKSLVRAEAMRVASETTLEQTLSTLDLGVLAAAGRKRTSEPYRTTFPNGLTGAVSPRGRAQLAEGLRIANHLVPAAGDSPPAVTDGLKTEVATLRGELADFARTLDAEDAVHAAVATAFLNELAARRAWREQYRKDFGLLTAHFGADKRKIESFFKKPTKSRPTKKEA